MTPDEIAVWVGAESFSRVRRLLALTFRSGPGPQIVTKGAVAATVVAEWSARRAAHPASALTFLKGPPAAWAPAVLEPVGHDFSYYDGLAVHERAEQHGAAPGEVPHSKFEGILPLVRLQLPAAPAAAGGVIAQTAIGTVFVNDHLLTSVPHVQREMNVRFGLSFGSVQRVDVVTPARASGRFGAISLYLGYREGDATPSFYILEAGLATGAPVRLYPARDLSKILQAPTAYLPTPFVQLSNSYDGELRLEQNDPATLVVRSFREPRNPAAGWRVQVVVTYLPRTAATVSKQAPGDLTLVAAERIAAIGAAIGVRAVPEQGLLASAGNKLPWIRPPRS
jgi:hypothetical protein